MPDIDKMEAGAELNALVIGRLGWRAIGWCGDNPIWEDADDNNVWNGPFRPSTDWAAAGEVWDELNRQGWLVTVICQPGKAFCSLCRLSGKSDELCPRKEAVGPTVPLAICRAACKAVEIVFQK